MSWSRSFNPMPDDYMPFLRFGPEGKTLEASETINGKVCALGIREPYSDKRLTQLRRACWETKELARIEAAGVEIPDYARKDLEEAGIIPSQVAA